MSELQKYIVGSDQEQCPIILPFDETGRTGEWQRYGAGIMYKAEDVDSAIAAKDAEIERYKRAVEDSRQFFVLLRHHADSGSQRMIDDALSLIATQSHQHKPVHTDDIAVDRFAATMKSKLAKKRGEGRAGWDDEEFCPVDWLKQEMRRHCFKGDPVDVANFAMMIWNREQGIKPAAAVGQDGRE